jgi:hypothetical protein
MRTYGTKYDCRSEPSIQSLAQCLVQPVTFTGRALFQGRFKAVLHRFFPAWLGLPPSLADSPPVIF